MSVSAEVPDMCRLTRCLKALNQCHTNHGGDEPVGRSGDKISVNVVEGNLLNLASISGSQIALRFAEQIVHVLSEPEFEQLLGFLEQEVYDQESISGLTNDNVENHLHQFYEEEIRISNATAERLARPGGSINAGLGIILHCQSEDDTINAFWDPQSATIAMLKEKGIDGSFCFGFDWHWRAQKSFSARPGCPTRKWSKKLTALHDEFSTKILDLLHLPFLVTASRCARLGIRKVLSEEARTLVISMGPQCGDIQIDLDFQRSRLRRIITHVHHPAAGFFMSRKDRPYAAIRIDASMTLMLWLLGRPHDPIAFLKRYSNRPVRYAWNAPLQEMWSLRRQEIEQGRILGIQEYLPTFISWAGRYLGQDPHHVVRQGKSLVGEIADDIRAKMSHAQKNRTGKGKRTRGNEMDDKQSPMHQSPQKSQKTNHSRRRILPQADHIDTTHAIQSQSPIESSKTGIALQPTQRAHLLRKLKLVMPRFSEVRSHLPCTNDSLNKNISIHRMGMSGGSQDDDNEHKYTKTLDLARLPRVQDSTERTLHPRQESIAPVIDNSVFTWSSSSSSLPLVSAEVVSADDTHQRTPDNRDHGVISLDQTFDVHLVLSKTIREPLVDSVPIVVPDDDLCENDQIKIQMQIDHPIHEDLPLMKDLNETLVQLTTPTYLQLIEAPKELPLGITFGSRHTSMFRNSSEPLRVKFSSTEIQICNGETVLFTKPYETLLSCALAVPWFLQLLHELRNVTKPASKFGNNNVRPLRIEAKGHFHNGQLKRRLHEGSFFKVNQQFSKGKLFGQRVHFRGVQIGIPMSADPETVYLQAFLMPKDQKHLHPCVTGGRPNDPANRLGIRAQYRTLSGSTKSYWVKLNGDRNVLKINSLVDFLEEKDIDFTEEQERRFLNHRTSCGRYSKTGYTSSAYSTTSSATVEKM